MKRACRVGEVSWDKQGESTFNLLDKCSEQLIAKSEIVTQAGQFCVKTSESELLGEPKTDEQCFSSVAVAKGYQYKKLQELNDKLGEKFKEVLETAMNEIQQEEANMKTSDTPAPSEQAVQEQAVQAPQATVGGKRQMQYIASSPRVPDGKIFNTQEEAKEWVKERMRKGDSSAGYGEWRPV